jgi:hypothetical protein
MIILPPDAENARWKEVIEILIQKKLALWTLISLSHDLGYPIEKTKKANMVISKMISNFGFLTLQDLKYEFNIVHQTAIQQLLKMLGSVIVWTTSDTYKVGSQPGLALDFSKSFENFDHGIMSAFLLQKHLDFICDNPHIEGIDISFKDPKKAAMITLVINLLCAISSHTSKNHYNATFRNFESLLFICDELEEFSRYARSEDSFDWIHLKCRTQIELTGTELHIDFTFDNKKVASSFLDNIELFFKTKIRKFHFRFEPSQENIEAVSIQCEDITKHPPTKFKYTRTLTETKIITPDKEIKDIVGYMS